MLHHIYPLIYTFRQAYSFIALRVLHGTYYLLSLAIVYFQGTAAGFWVFQNLHFIEIIAKSSQRATRVAWNHGTAHSRS